MNFMIPHLDILGWLLVITGFFDGYKYHIEAQKIRSVRTAKGHSRKFINWAASIDMYRLYYLLHSNRDIFLILATTLAILFMLEMWWVIYIYYPYRRRRLKGFRRPNVLLYLWNSLLPNSIRRKM